MSQPSDGANAMRIAEGGVTPASVPGSFSGVLTVDVFRNGLQLMGTASISQTLGHVKRYGHVTAAPIANAI
ncbi:hypothetical protein [Streptomyces cahuitamycinicus]|uniref:Uncharacterized protein n=1 Tax=Streptomyces cahuitamycinicus TaxID=2070367 RepID=A0A2N8THV1_9ACTN|nr:hypothetical protein [Streptomyces cahuitamycinicus]PNG18583.1 hypothetical protein C1J00_30325 [Streptomyces cahuitamycinicus]